MSDKTVTTRTKTKTLWTQTLLDDLANALRKNKSDAAIRSLLSDLKGKGLPPRYLVEKMREQIDDQAALRLQRIVAGKSAAARGVRAAGKPTRSGFVSALREFFRG